MSEVQAQEDIDWPSIRHEYETRKQKAAAICLAYNITPAQLRYRRQQQGWISQRSRKVDRADLINRMLRIFEKQLARLEKTDVGGSEKEINLLSTASKTLEKLIDIQDAERGSAQVGEDSKEMRDLQRKLEIRINAITKG